MLLVERLDLAMLVEESKITLSAQNASVFSDKVEYEGRQIRSKVAVTQAFEFCHQGFPPQAHCNPGSTSMFQTKGSWEEEKVLPSKEPSQSLSYKHTSGQNSLLARIWSA